MERKNKKKKCALANQYLTIHKYLFISNPYDNLQDKMIAFNSLLQVNLANRLVAYDDDDYVPSAAKFSVSNPLPERIP